LNRGLGFFTKNHIYLSNIKSLVNLKKFVQVQLYLSAQLQKYTQFKLKIIKKHAILQAMAISKIVCFLIYACIFAIAHLNKLGLEQIFFSLNKLLILLYILFFSEKKRHQIQNRRKQNRQVSAPDTAGVWAADER
jgi:hypothetical protein